MLKWASPCNYVYDVEVLKTSIMLQRNEVTVTIVLLHLREAGFIHWVLRPLHDAPTFAADRRVL